jgi:hypothetical protein
MNNAIVQLNQTMEKNNLMPLTYALYNMNILFGGLTKPLDFMPSEQTDRLYKSK